MVAFVASAIWFSAPFELLLNNRFFITYYYFYNICLVRHQFYPLLLYIRLMPAFERNLAKLLSDSNRNRKRNPVN